MVLAAAGARDALGKFEHARLTTTARPLLLTATGVVHLGGIDYLDVWLLAHFTRLM